MKLTVANKPVKPTLSAVYRLVKVGTALVLQARR